MKRYRMVSLFLLFAAPGHLHGVYTFYKQSFTDYNHQIPSSLISDRKIKIIGSGAFFIYLYDEARHLQLSRPGKPISITAVHSSLLQAQKRTG